MKKLKRLFRTKRGFSPVIAALILMLLAVAAGVVVYAYVMGWLGGATQTPGGVKGDLQFDSLWHNTSHIILTVRNVGHKTITPEKVYVDGISKTFTGSFAALGPNDVSNEIIVTHALTAGYFCEVKVTCTDGTVASQSVESKS